jgi:GNAT superfamily N-acetyltransferase
VGLEGVKIVKSKAAGSFRKLAWEAVIDRYRGGSLRRDDNPFRPGERSLIKIEPLFATDYAQARALMRFDEDALPGDSQCGSRSLFLRGLAFWQHWLPCQMHIAPSVYVAKEDGVLLGIIVLRSTGKSKLCWQVDHLIVHPHHRGRGVAQELLRYVFALFGSQGANHFIAEVSDNNSAALQLYGSCGFRRCAKTTHFQLEISGGEPAEPIEGPFRIAQPSDRQPLFLLHQEALPPDIRLIMNYSPEDFGVSEFRLEKAEALRRRVMRKHGWYWVAEDTERRVLTAAVKLYAHQPGDLHMEVTVHPGRQDVIHYLVGYALSEVRRMGETGIISARAFDFHPAALDALADNGMERTGECCFLAREHWVRSKYPRKQKIERQLGIPTLPNPAVNLPLATERNQLN